MFSVRMLFGDREILLSVLGEYFDFRGVSIFSLKSEEIGISRLLPQRVCKIICVNHHRLFDTPVFCIMHNGFDNTVISWKKLVEKFLGGNDYVTEN